MIGKIFYDDILFRRLYPEFVNVPMPDLKLLWIMARRYVDNQPEVFPVATSAIYHQVLAHVAKLNLMAQLGMKIKGKTEPVLVPPSSINPFKNWLQQTVYGRAIG